MNDGNNVDSGHSPGTVAPETLARSGRQGRTLDSQSTALPGWPRLLSETEAARYLGLSVWSFREVWQARQVEPVRVPRVDSAKMRRRQHVNDTLRKLLFDRASLDALVEKWKVSAC